MNIVNIYRAVPRSERGGLLSVFLSALLSALLDLVGIAALVSVLVAVLDQDLLERSAAVRSFAQWAGITTRGGLIVTASVAVVVVVALKIVASLLLSRRRLRWVASLFESLSTREYTALLSAGCRGGDRLNSSEQIVRVNQVCHRFAYGVVNQLIVLSSESVLLIALAIALVFLNPTVLLLTVAVFVPVTLLWVFGFRRRLADEGQSEHRLQVAQNRLVAESVRGSADIETANVSQYYLDRFGRNTAQINAHRLSGETLRSASSLLTELLLVVGVAVICVVAVLVDYPIEMLKVTLGIFVVVAYRITPCIRRMVGAVQELRRNSYTVPLVADVRPTAPIDTSADRLPFSRSIVVNNISFDYGRGSVIDNLSFTVNRGDYVAVRGVSGAGKTTLLNIIAGLIDPRSGSVEVDSVPITPLNRRSWQNNIAFVRQDIFLTDSTIAANVAFGVEPEAVDRDRLDRALHDAGLDEWVAQLPAGVDTAVGELGERLSGGERKRIAIARALYRRASLLIMDEATVSLDPNSESHILELLANLKSEHRNPTLLFVTHSDSAARFCDRTITI